MNIDAYQIGLRQAIKNLAKNARAKAVAEKQKPRPGSEIPPVEPERMSPKMVG